MGIFLTETWLSSDTSDAELSIPNFTIIRSDRVGRARGGVAMYLRNELYPKKMYELSNGVVELVS